MSLDLATAEDDILEAIDMIRPALQSDGGDIVYQGVDPDGVVHVTPRRGLWQLPGVADDAEGRRRADHHGPGARHHRSRRGLVAAHRSYASLTPGMPADADALVDRALAGDRVATAKVLSLVEQGGEGARTVVSRLHPHTGRAWSVGITGAPGAGKSTLTDELVMCVRDEDLDVGVLAVDPSSPFSGGAILGDRVRMQRHSTDPGVFIRSMASRGHLGGLALATPQVGARARRGRQAVGDRRDGRRRTGRGRDRKSGRHDDRRRQSGLG